MTKFYLYIKQGPTNDPILVPAFYGRLDECVKIMRQFDDCVYWNKDKYNKRFKIVSLLKDLNKNPLNTRRKELHP